jgi:hypothetical protein
MAALARKEKHETATLFASTGEKLNATSDASSGMQAFQMLNENQK